MKKVILSVVVVVFVTIMVVNVNLSKSGKFSDLMLENIEALAQGEGEGGKGCFSCFCMGSGGGGFSICDLSKLYEVAIQACGSSTVDCIPY